MEAVSMMTIRVELDNRAINGNTLLIPFTEVWLAENTCRQLLENVLAIHLNKPDLLNNAESVKMFCVKQQDTVTGSGKKARVDKEMANATACLEYSVSFVIDSFSTNSFYFKIFSLPRQATVRPVVNPLQVLMQSRATFVSLPPRLDHQRMHAGHNLQNELLDFLEKHNLGWNSDEASTLGKNFVDGMSKAFFQCTPSVWKALNDRHNIGAFVVR